MNVIHYTSTCVNVYLILLQRTSGNETSTRVSVVDANPEAIGARVPLLWDRK